MATKLRNLSRMRIDLEVVHDTRKEELVELALGVVAVALERAGLCEVLGASGVAEAVAD
jgi:hypothetical protein